MDESLKILLNSEKNVDSVNIDANQKVMLNNRLSNLREYEIRNVLSATEVFDTERNASEVYRIYGKIEWLSILNGLSNNYSQLNDFFSPVLSNNKTPLNSFDYYLVKPSTTITKIGTTGYIRYFEVIATPNDFNILSAGFSNNVYGEKSYAFTFNDDYDISSYIDAFEFPLTELYLYARYKRKANGANRNELLQYTYWNTSGSGTSKKTVNSSSLRRGDIVYGDLIEYNKNEFQQTELSPQTYFITTYYSGSNRLIWEYNPFTPFKLRYFSEELYNVNINDTSYDQTQSIPSYATEVDGNGNYVWREILPQGYIDPLTGIGVDYPFVNNRRYLYSNIILNVIPDLDDANTRNVFNDIWFTRNSEIIDTTPIGDLDDIGQPCQ